MNEYKIIIKKKMLQKTTLCVINVIVMDRGDFFVWFDFYKKTITKLNLKKKKTKPIDFNSV